MPDPTPTPPSTAPVIAPRWAGRTLGQGSATHHHEGEAFIPPGGKLVISQAAVLCGLKPDDVTFSDAVLYPPMAGFDNTNLMIGDKKLPTVAAEAAAVLLAALAAGDVTIVNKAVKQAYFALRVNVNKK